MEVDICKPLRCPGCVSVMQNLKKITEGENKIECPNCGKQYLILLTTFKADKGGTALIVESIIKDTEK